MTSSGPLRDPDSKRGIAEGGLAEAIQEELEIPSWLKKAERIEFELLVEKQRRAQVGIRAVDAEAYGNYVRMSIDFRNSKDARERLAIRRGLDALGMQLCIGEYARQRVGIRGRKSAPKGKLEVMRAKRNGTTGDA